MAAKVKSSIPPGKQLIDGFLCPAGWKRWHYHLFRFGTEPHGETKLEHWKKFVELLWPDPVFIWDEWADLFFGALCGATETIERLTGKKFNWQGRWYRQLIATGAGSVGKTTKAAMWIVGNWMCEQEATTCCLTSTSLDMVKKRIWGDVCNFIEKAADPLPLKVLQGDCEVRWNPNDKRGAIFCRAVDEGGDVRKAVGRIKGVHNRRMFVVIDEMPSVPEAITLACRNLNKGTLEYQLLGLGNAEQMTDQHGQYSEPMDGWDSVTVEDTFWLTKFGGCAIHFDAYKSPGLANPTRFHFYPTAQEIEEDKVFAGGENNPWFWSNVRGFWPPTGLSNTVMDDAMLTQFHVEQPAKWQKSFIMCGAFDVAFEGGDRRVLYPFKLGEFTSGVTGIEFQPPIIISVDMTQDKRWLPYLIADAVKSECERKRPEWGGQSILPENFASDVTGEGGSFFSILSGRWSPLINAVEFGGAADDTVVSSDRPVTYKELYGNRVTMLWYVMRRFIEGDQVRGLTDAETKQELTTRKYSMKAGKTVVEPKSKMKGNGHRSPDKADAAVIAAHILRMKGVQPAGATGGESFSAEAWKALVEKSNIDDDESAYEDAEAAFA